MAMVPSGDKLKALKSETLTTVGKYRNAVGAGAGHARSPAAQ